MGPGTLHQLSKETKQRQQTVLSALHTLLSLSLKCISHKNKDLPILGIIRECKNERTPKTTRTTTMSIVPNHDKKENNENKKRLTKRLREVGRGKKTRRPSWCECEENEEFPGEKRRRVPKHATGLSPNKTP